MKIGWKCTSSVGIIMRFAYDSCNFYNSQKASNEGFITDDHGNL